MVNEQENKIEYPDYLSDQPLAVRRIWEKWYRISERIDNHPKRFITLNSINNDTTKVFDLKNSKGFLMNMLKSFGVSKEDYDLAINYKDEIYKLQKEKAKLNRSWSKHVYSGEKGDNSVLTLKYDELIDLFGSYYSQNEVWRILLKQGFSINQERLRKFQIDNREKINLKKMEYLTKKNDFRLGTDTGRLEVLTKLANENIDKYEETKSLVYSREVRSILEQIRKEVKGEEIRLTVEGKIDINATIAANRSMNEVFSKLPINLVVVALTAAKTGTNPGKMMNMLANSYYSKWNGFSKLEDKDSIQLPGKLIKTYDWTEIKKLNEDIQIEEVEVEEVLPIIDKIEFTQNKNNLMDLLKDYREKFNKNQ